MIFFRIIRKQQLIFFLLLLFNFLKAQNYSTETEAKIKDFENNFSAYWFSSEGERAPTLLDRMNFYHVKGLSIAVVHDYKIEWAKAYGWADSAEQRKATTETLFQACSVSKSLNAVGILKLAQEKKLDLYSDINNYLTSWKFPYDENSAGKKITTANLLSHTAGLSIHGFAGYPNGKNMPTVVQVLDGISPAKNNPVRSEHKPGLRYQYSGGGVTISQLIVMDIAHDDYAEYMQKNVLGPIGMTNSFYIQPVPKEKEELLASGYLEDGKAIPQKYYAIPQAAGGMWTTPTDICKYIIEMQLSLQGKSNKVLSKDMTTLMMTPYIDESCALGVFIDKKGNEKYFQHSGGNIGFKCQFIGSIDKGNGMMVMANSSSGGIINEAVINIARIYGWKDYSVPMATAKKGIIIKEEKELDKYTGTYRDGDVIIRIIKRDNALWYQGFQGGGTNAWKIYFTSDKDFFSRESRASATP